MNVTSFTSHIIFHSESADVTHFHPGFPGQYLNTGQCNKLHINQQCIHINSQQVCFSYNIIGQTHVGYIWIAQDNVVRLGILATKLVS